MTDKPLKLNSREPLRQAIDRFYLADEAVCVRQLLESLRLSTTDDQIIRQDAERLVRAVRKKGEFQSGIEAFMHEYNLSSEEGVVLMCLAEAHCGHSVTGDLKDSYPR